MAVELLGWTGTQSNIVVLALPVLLLLLLRRGADSPDELAPLDRDLNSTYSGYSGSPPTTMLRLLLPLLLRTLAHAASKDFDDSYAHEVRLPAF